MRIISFMCNSLPFTIFLFCYFSFVCIILIFHPKANWKPCCWWIENFLRFISLFFKNSVVVSPFWDKNKVKAERETEKMCFLANRIPFYSFHLFFYSHSRWIHFFLFFLFLEMLKKSLMRLLFYSVFWHDDVFIFRNAKV